MEKFDYYVYIDYSEDLIGYIIIEKSKMKDLLKKITKFRHFKKVKHDTQYISSIKKRIETEKIIQDLFKLKIVNCRVNLELFVEVIEFIKKNRVLNILISVDDNFYIMFLRLISTLGYQDNISIMRESKLKKDSNEYRPSLIIDNLLTIERRKLKSK